jgi:hypothetical protein
LYGFQLRDALPTIPIPLNPGDTEPLLNLQTVFNAVYDQASFDLVIDYQQDPVPPLPEDDRGWVQQLVSLPKHS